MMSLKSAISLILIFSALSLNATIIYIPSDYPAIQSGIDAADDGDTIIIDPGEYFEHLVISEKDLIIGSRFILTNDTSFITQTILNGNGTGRGIWISDTDNPARISGLTITNCRSTSGAAILVMQSYIMIDNVRIIGNTAHCESTEFSAGGGISVYSSTVILANFLLKSNKAFCITPPVNPYGGGLYANNSNLELLNGQILNNEAYLGAGIFVINSTLQAESTEFKENFAPYVGCAICSFNSGIALDRCNFMENNAPGAVLYHENEYPTVITNCLFANNIGRCINVTETLGIVNCTFVNNSNTSILLGPSSNLHLMNSIFWNNSAYEIEFYLSNNLAILGHVAIKNGIAGIKGNVNLTYFGPVFDFNPGFISNSDYRLSDSSQCIGAGLDTLFNYPHLAAPDIDLEGNARPDPAGSMPDLGAYENELANPLTGLVENLSPVTLVKIYPNPARDIFTIATEQGNKIQSVRIIEPSGTEVLYCSFRPEPVESCTVNTSDHRGKGFVIVEINLETEKVFLKAMIY